MFEHNQVSSQYQFCSLLPCFPCSTTDTQNSSYEDVHEHSCACAQAAAAQQLLRETAMHWEFNAKTLPELVLIYSILNK